MTPDRWQQVKNILAAALEREPAKRGAYLDQVCAEPSLRREVESLIAAHEQGDGSFMEHPVVESGSLKSGTKLGPYEILSPLGVGGMGEVYQAHDSKLRRDVAIKVLPAAFVNDPERLSRFQREARMLASLNHPNIATIHGLEQSDGVNYLVMELVPGQTLAERVSAGPVPIKEALAICSQIAEALEAAHEKGVIHRDLKSANVKVTPEGKVKVLDFGLAKAFAGDREQDLSQDFTVTAMGTEDGRILGTPAYMSPEQARGKAVDKRTDIWSFGCLLFELLTAKRAFGGESVQDSIAAVLEREPDWQALPFSTPAQILSLLKRCLQKDKAERLRDAGDIHLEIRDVLAASQGSIKLVGSVSPTPVWRQAYVLAPVGLLVGSLIAGFAIWMLKPAVPKPVTRFTMTLPPGQVLNVGWLAVAISPDGTRLVYSAGPTTATTQLYIRAMDGLEARPIPGTEGGGNPFFSPDGQWLGFTAGDILKKVSLNGGSPVDFVHLSSTGAGQSNVSSSGPVGGSWSTQGMIALGLATGPLQELSAAGGEFQTLTHLEKGEISHRWPDFLPDGKAVLFTAVGASGTAPKLAAQSLATSEHRNLMQIQSGIRPRYVPSGHLVYGQGPNLMAVPFDAQRLAVTGAAVPVVEGVLSWIPGSEGVLSLNGYPQYSFSSTGSLVFVPDIFRQAAHLKFVWVDRKGAEQPVNAPPHNYVLPRISPDGKRVAASIEEGDSQIWVYDVGRDILTRLTFDRSGNIDPIWTPDGKRIVFKGPGNRLFWQPADGSGTAEELSKNELAQNNVPGSWSPDGQVLAFLYINPGTDRDIYTLSLKDSKAQPFLRTLNASAPCFSPDGHFIAYSSDESGRVEIYVKPYPGPGGKWQISTEGGNEPVWNPKGGELFYRAGNKIIAVDVTARPSFSAGKPRVLFEGPYARGGRSSPDYDVSSDGQRFLMLKATEQAEAAPTQINVVLNWFEELKRRVPAKP